MKDRELLYDSIVIKLVGEQPNRVIDDETLNPDANLRASQAAPAAYAIESNDEVFIEKQNEVVTRGSESMKQRRKIVRARRP